MCGRVAKLLRRYASKTLPPKWRGGDFRRVVYKRFNNHELTIAQVKAAVGCR